LKKLRTKGVGSVGVSLARGKYAFGDGEVKRVDGIFSRREEKRGLARMGETNRSLFLYVIRNCKELRGNAGSCVMKKYWFEAKKKSHLNTPKLLNKNTTISKCIASLT
jgi:hypothetical protein